MICLLFWEPAVSTKVYLIALTVDNRYKPEMIWVNRNVGLLFLFFFQLCKEGGECIVI